MKIIYHTKPQRLLCDELFTQEISLVIRQQMSANPVDTLVFLPGKSEIEKVKRALEKWAHEKDFFLVSLHGSLSIDEQQNTLKIKHRPRVILSTNIAESSITLDGVAQVIDSGLARQNSYNIKTGLSQLELTRISRSSATQRAGRSARQTSGVVYRVWMPYDELSMPEADQPEIMRTEITDLTLMLASHGIKNFSSFSWLEAPPEHLFTRAIETLKSAGALNDDLSITARGQKIVALPLDTRLAHFCLHGLEQGIDAYKIAKITAILQEKDFLSPFDIEAHLAENFECDLLLRLELFERKASLQVKKVAKQILALLEKMTPYDEQSLNLSEEEKIKLCLFLSYPDRLCRRRQKINQDAIKALMVGGRGAILTKESVVRTSEHFIAAQAFDKNKAESHINMASGISKELLDFTLQKFFSKDLNKKSDLIVDEQSGKVQRHEFLCYKDLPLSAPIIRPATNEEIENSLTTLCVQNFKNIQNRNIALNKWLLRWNFFQKIIQAEADHFLNSENLLKIFEQVCFGEKNLAAILAKNIVAYFEAYLELYLAPAEFKKMQTYAPERLQAPSGNWFEINYSDAQRPSVAIRLQEVFGWSKNPILAGKIPIVLHLLGPNYRPVQVTSDLASFWQNGYTEVRKELRSRYPKHSWPDDPLRAQPVARGPARKK
jgi:ATP-dependent helicase HrpB